MSTNYLKQIKKEINYIRPHEEDDLEWYNEGIILLENNKLDEAEKKYASPLEVPLIFAYNDTFINTRYLNKNRPLKIDGEDVRQFVNHYTAMRFVDLGPEIYSAPP